MSPKVFVIAEAGVNHNGSVELAKELVHAAAEAGADAVKFQTFRAETLVTRDAAKAGYQQKSDPVSESQYQMLKRLELGFEDFAELKSCCERNRIRFLSTPFDLTTIRMLDELGVDLWKLPSGEITNLPYLREVGRKNQEIILSTGMCEMDEIRAALRVLEEAGTPLSSITLLHCNTEYPTPMEDVNLRAMDTLRREFPSLRGVGYSDHTLGVEVPVAAVALGATVIEKHFTTDRSLPGPDHAASLEPGELREMVRFIRNIELALGSADKKPSPSERKNREVARKSLVAATDIPKGEIFTPLNLGVKRPGTGVSPMRWDDYIGRPAGRDYRKDELIDA